MIYLDHASTTPCAQEVIDEMLPFFRDSFANASSIDHIPGNDASRAVEKARESIAALVGVRANEIIFTSGSTEANNLAVSSAHSIIITAIEHPSIRDTVIARRNESDVTLQVDANGLIDIDELRETLRVSSVTLVSIIATNNETGTEQQLGRISQCVKEAGSLLHFDATQTIALRSLELSKTQFDGISLSAHKINGPKGIGALIVRNGLRRLIRPMIHGGGHERGLRSGTLNVPGIVGFGAAADLALKNGEHNREKVRAVKAEFLSILYEKLGERIQQTITSDHASPHILSLRIEGINGRALLGEVRQEVAFSLGAACATLKSEPSHVLLEIGLDKSQIAQTIRLSFSPEQTKELVRQAAEIISIAAFKLLEYSEN